MPYSLYSLGYLGNFGTFINFKVDMKFMIIYFKKRSKTFLGPGSTRTDVIFRYQYVKQLQVWKYSLIKYTNVLVILRQQTWLIVVIFFWYAFLTICSCTGFLFLFIYIFSVWFICVFIFVWFIVLINYISLKLTD